MIKRALVAGAAAAVLAVCACRTDPFFGKVEGVTGTLTAPNGSTPLPGAKLTIADVKPRGYYGTGITDSRGTFAFPAAPDGTYRLTATSANGLFTTSFFTEVLDGYSPAGVVVSIAPARANTFIAFPGRYDRMGSILEDLGYPYREGDTASLALNPNPLNGADLALLDSGCDASEAANDAVIANIRSFVAAGGRLFVTDRAWPFIAGAWPDKVDWGTNPEIGIGGQVVTAAVSEEALKHAMWYSTWRLDYDQPTWALPASTTGVVFARGNVRTTAGTRNDAPLLIGFPYEKGFVVYATFGWKRQLYRDRLAVRAFQYLIADR